MKKSLLAILLSVLFFGCGSGPKQDEPKTDSTVKKEPLVYPFTSKYSLNWQPGDEKYAVLALTAFKKYLDGDVKGSFEYFADSIEFFANKFHFSGKKDSLLAMFIPMRAEYASMSIEPDTWITTYYPDKNDTWVTLWSTQKWTDKKGKMDSVYIVDDILVKDGKIAEVDEKQREFPANKMMKK
ncbi:MAG TPA: hypothetical protein VGH64_05020 [Puia sp.]